MKELVRELLTTQSVCEELKDVSKAYLAAIGTNKEADEQRRLIREIREDIMTIDSLAAFSETDMAREIFGDGYGNFKAHVDEIKANGAEYCDCPACTVCLKILEKIGE